MRWPDAMPALASRPSDDARQHARASLGLSPKELAERGDPLDGEVAPGGWPSLLLNFALIIHCYYGSVPLPPWISRSRSQASLLREGCKLSGTSMSWGHVIVSAYVRNHLLRLLDHGNAVVQRPARYSEDCWRSKCACVVMDYGLVAARSAASGNARRAQ